ncbi:MAG: hypothetical protein LBM71_01100 [Elusimicrobiota bacterium]|jgi:flagellar hook assembly protein FlgD|nr:hypothetical protein [Elusimicrobiota bacterium]
MIKNKIDSSKTSFIKSFNGKNISLIKVCVFAFAFLGLHIVAYAQTAMLTNNIVGYRDNSLLSADVPFNCDTANSLDSWLSIDPDISRTFDKSHITAWFTDTNYVDPYKYSSLIETDQVAYRWGGHLSTYPNHCLSLCAEITCTNPVRTVEAPDNSSTENFITERSGEFPIQSVLFEIFKYQLNSNPYNPDSTPPIRTIAIYPNGNNICPGVDVTEDEDDDDKIKPCCQECDFPSHSVKPGQDGNCAATCAAFDDNDSCLAGRKTLHFCAPWDGSYEIDGEFGKSNGTFGYRTTISSQWPGDGVTTPEIDLTHTIVFPGMQQVPIRVDVTNVHSVRSTATFVGQVQKVAAEPYNISYRLSKDALMKVEIIDPNTLTREATGTGTIHRTLINNEPRLGEGTPGGPSAIDTVTTEVEQWDGRDNNGRLLPYGNYLIYLQARSEDEWSAEITSPEPRTDISRPTTRQISLDPLKITDLVSVGLNETSTGYAMLSYMLTEPASVHVEIYTPGTTFSDLSMITNGDAASTIASRITAGTGTRIASFIEQKASRVAVNTKWDGRCWDQDNCTAANGLSLGAVMPDGDYVYVIWAEIPYTNNATITINDVIWNGVKTRLFHTGTLPINKGLPRITVQPVGHSTIGSSPMASGLDPFIFNFSLSRDSVVSADIVTTSTDANGNIIDGAPFTVKTLMTNQVQMSNKMNTASWDGIDNNGRYVSPGVYMLQIVAKDNAFPLKVATATVSFPVDLFRVVDVHSTSISGDATSQATVSYTISKPMHVKLAIYDRDVVIPNPNLYDDANAPWPPVNCTLPLNPNPHCLYYKDTTRDPSTIAPIKIFEGNRPGEGSVITEFWDGNLTPSNIGATAQQEVMADGLYPYLIYAENGVASSVYYKREQVGTDAMLIPQDPQISGGFVDSLPSTDRPTGYIDVSRGRVYFTQIQINPSKPQMFHSSDTVAIPVYEVQFAVTRTAKVTIQVRSTTLGACMGPTEPAGTVCRNLTLMDSNNPSSIYDPVIVNKVYWDGKDEKGNYVKKDAYEFRFFADQYPQTVPPQETTVASEIQNVNNFRVFDRYINDVYNNTAGKFSYQVSVPMKVGIQIFKPGTKVASTADGTLVDPANPANIVNSSNVKDVLVKAIVGIRPHLVALEDVWDGTDYIGQKVPDGSYPFRYVTVLDSYDMDSITGALTNDATPQDIIADWDKYVNLDVINVANGDSWYADIDWKDNKVTAFYPNPLRQSQGYFEISKVPAPGLVTIKIFNIAGDLVKESGYQCTNVRGVTSTLEEINATGGIQPDWNIAGAATSTVTGGRNFALRCAWDRTNNHGKKVARGLYYAIMELTPTKGNAKKSQKVIKILIP